MALVVDVTTLIVIPDTFLLCSPSEARFYLPLFFPILSHRVPARLFPNVQRDGPTLDSSVSYHFSFVLSLSPVLPPL